ncbi:hypothetical protein GCM10027289_20040 [Tsukamurella serpentis]
MNFNDIVNKAKDALGKNPGMLDKAGDFVNDKTGGKYADQIGKAKDAAQKFTGQQGQPGEQGPAPEQGQAPAPEQAPEQPQQGQNPDQPQ